MTRTAKSIDKTGVHVYNATSGLWEPWNGALRAGTAELGNVKISDGTETANVTANNELNVLDSDIFVEASRGNISNMSTVNKFGEAPSGIQTTETDIWSRANATPTQSVWLAPTAARIHTIQSDSASDVASGVGATTVIVYYLPDWDTAETTETVTGDLNAGIAMNNAAVMIHRMKVTPQATSTSANVGTITATAATDATITAVILPGDGQTEMAIYGVPSTKKAYLKRWSGGIDKTQGAAATADFIIRLNPNPDVQTVSFLRKQDFSVQSTGTNYFEKSFELLPCYDGPCIIKVTAIGSAADIDGQADFDLLLVDN